MTLYSNIKSLNNFSNVTDFNQSSSQCLALDNKKTMGYDMFGTLPLPNINIPLGGDLSVFANGYPNQLFSIDFGALTNNLFQNTFPASTGLDFSKGLFGQNLQLPTFSFPQIDFGSLFNSALPSFDFGNFDTTANVVSGTGPLKNQLLDRAMSYVGQVDTDYKGNKLFSPRNPDGSVKENWGWCCDFATKLASDVYGDKLPKGFKTSSPLVLKKWAVKNDCYNDVTGMSESEKKAWIAKNVKPGDIYIGYGRGTSKHHVAIVKSVNPDGTFTTVDGNSGDAVKVVPNRKPNGNVYGFVVLDKFAV